MEQPVLGPAGDTGERQRTECRPILPALVKPLHPSDARIPRRSQRVPQRDGSARTARRSHRPVRLRSVRPDRSALRPALLPNLGKLVDAPLTGGCSDRIQGKRRIAPARRHFGGPPGSQGRGHPQIIRRGTLATLACRPAFFRHRLLTGDRVCMYTMRCEVGSTREQPQRWVCHRPQAQIRISFGRIFTKKKRSGRDGTYISDFCCDLAMEA